MKTPEPKYPDCDNPGESCKNCSLSNYGRDCHNNVIDKLRQLRTAAGLTQKGLANAAGVNYHLIQRYESGECSPANMTVRTAMVLAKALGCEVSDFV